MSTASTIVSDSRPLGREYVRAGTAVAILTFLLPLFSTWWMLYVVEHNFRNAEVSETEIHGDVDLSDESAGSSATRQISLLALGAIGATLLLLPSREPIAVNKWLLALILALGALVVLSAVWAEDSTLSLKRSVQPLLLALGAAGFVKHWQPRQLCLFVVALTSGVLLLGFATTCVMGTFLQGPAYRFGGTLHPNLQGVNCAALCLASLALLCEPRSRGGGFRWRWLAPLLIGLAFLYLTRSRTTSIALLAAFGAFFIVKAPLARTSVILLIGAMLIPSALVLWLGAESDTSNLLFDTVQMGRDDDAQSAATLTGRVLIWRQVASDIEAKPLLGYGYGAFWTPQRIWDYSFILDWQFNHAHSAYLETMLNNGALGLLLGLLIVISAALMAGRDFRLSGEVGYRFVFAVLTLALIDGAADSNFVIVGFAPLLALMCIFLIVLQGKPPLEIGCSPVE